MNKLIGKPFCFLVNNRKYLMKILLLGEFSSLHQNLKEGLEELGHDARVASIGDGWKKIISDIDFSSTLPGSTGKIVRSLKPLLKIKSLSNYDVVQFINPFIFQRRFGINKYILNTVLKNNQTAWLLAAGIDSIFMRVGYLKLEYSPVEGWKKYDLKNKQHFYESEDALAWNTRLAREVDGIIPIMYDYSVGYEGFKNRQKTIPIPVNTRRITYKELRVPRKVNILHGLLPNRGGFKGSHHIKEAFDYLNARYANDLECRILGGVPLQKYLKILEKTDVLVDQTTSYSCGVNAVYALAMGKVVLSGAEPQSLQEFGWEYSPVRNIRPSRDSVIQQIEQILSGKKNMPQWSYESRKFAEDHHSHIDIAQQYLQTWKV